MRNKIIYNVRFSVNFRETLFVEYIVKTNNRQQYIINNMDLKTN